ncbi:HlyD family secretion protein [Prolixibacter denitrificans]|uniref:HlyD family secretion protein n=1 Tax=Prolixibacter denitrificans TaxID=1541063 RepID=A0A2P8CJH3_9BACT|nr:HlyD family efflux transporter periplasmic adaptor subunit [Prolixibacter denitrificans]PSK85128.1 HlyD family secretion protein [Prolixibacter denitrificans]GET23670.1 membrane protein [Prolixibacter denitrificans]
MKRITKLKYLFAFAAGVLLMSCNRNDKLSDAYGNFEVDDVIVSSQVTGNLLQFNLSEGDQLKASEQVGLVDTTQLYLKKEQLEAQKASIRSKMTSVQTQIAVVKQQKANAEVDKHRITKMLADSAATQKQMDDITGQIDVFNRQIANIRTQEVSLKKEIDVVNAQVAQIEDQLGKCDITAPISGTVLEKYKEMGELVTPGQSLFKIADLSYLNLKIYISGAQLAHVKLGEKVTVLIDNSKTTDTKLTGTITWISSQAEFTPKIIQTKEERVKLVYAVKVKVPNDGSLKIGMPGEVRFNHKN